MIQVDEHGDDLDQTIVVALIPDRSSDWRQNLYLIAALGFTCLAISLGFYFILGVWTILPFAGLEILALSAGLYYAQWKVNYRHVLTISADKISIAKGVYRPSKNWQLERFNTRLHIYPAKHKWEAQKLCLFDRNQQVTIGEFLSKDDLNSTVKLLAPLITTVRENKPLEP